MEKKKDPSFNGSNFANCILPYYGLSRELSESELFSLRLASMTPYSDTEPRSVTRARLKIETAEKVREHLLLSSLPPIFDSFEFEGLRLKGVA
jgi:hypothetical protein